MKKRKYVIVRTYSAGVFAGELESRKGQEVVLRKVKNQPPDLTAGEFNRGE